MALTALLMLVILPSAAQQKKKGDVFYDTVTGLACKVIKVDAVNGHEVEISGAGYYTDSEGEYKGELNIPATVKDSADVSYTVTAIGWFAFSKGAGNEKYDAFGWHKSYFTSVTFPNTLKVIRWMAFRNANLTDTLNFPASLTTIEGYAFDHCSDLTGPLNFPESLTTIARGAFGSCSGLTGITYTGEQVTKFGERVAYGCTRLEYLDLSSITSPYSDSIYFYILPYSVLVFSRTFAWNSSNLVSALPVNTVVYLPADFAVDKIVDGENFNFVYNGHCRRLVLADTCDYELPHAFTADTVQYVSGITIPANRTFDDNGGRNCVSVFLPYAFTTAPGLTAYELNTREGRTGRPYAEYFIFTPVTGATQPNCPYLLLGDGSRTFTSADLIPARNADGLIEVSATNKEYTDSGLIVPRGVTVGNFSFVGTTEKLSHAESLGYQALNIDAQGNDVFRPIDGNPKAYVGRFRGVIKHNGSAPAKPAYGLLLQESAATNIDRVQTDGRIAEGDRIYSLDGQYMGTDLKRLPGGMYIIRGKKIVKN